MLEIIEYGKDEYTFPSLVVLGCFDAIHAGHRELFKKAKLQAKINGLDLGVMMFRQGKGGKQVYSFEERLAMLAPYNVKFVLVIDYNADFKQIMPLDFLAAIEDKVNVKAYMSGKDFRFGKGAKGKSSTLKNYAEDEENGVWYMPVKDIALNGEKISTTLIKRTLDGGDAHLASQLLGENFYVEGTVVQGSHRGSGVLGFPTVNLNYPDWKYPIKHGVYKVAVTIDQTCYQGIANFGGRPTFGEDGEVLEVHIKDFQGDLYGKTIRVGFVGYMRSIIKFADAAALAARLEEDKAALDLSEEQFFALYPLAEQEEQPAEQVEEQPAEQEEQPAEQEEQPAEQEEQPAEQVEEQPAEQLEEQPAEQVEEQPAEQVEEQPAEQVEVIPQDEVAAASVADIVPAWKLLNEPEDLRITMPAEDAPAEIPAEEQAEEDPAEAPVEEQAEEDPAEAPVEEQAEEAPAEIPAEEQAEEAPAEVPAEEQAEEAPAEVPAEEQAEEAPAEVPAEEQTEESPAEVPAEEQAEEAPAEVPSEEHTENND